MRIAGAHIVFHRLLKTSEKRSVCGVLLCKGTQDAPVYPGHWGLFGGRLEGAERPKRAAIREVREELGIELREASVKTLCDVKIQRGNTRSALGVRYFSAELDLGMDCLTLTRNAYEDKVEGEGLGWFTAEEINHLMIRPADRIAVCTFFLKHGT